MDAIGKIVRDIIELKIEANNVPKDATMENMFEWFSWSFEHGLIEVTYKYGELQGYLEWIKLPRIPNSREEIKDIIDYDNDSSVLYITNCCVRDDQVRHGVLWKLIHMVREKQKNNFDTVCWHTGSEGVLHVYSNTKRTEMQLEGVLV